MSTTFNRGYALLIGVSDQLNPGDAVPLPATEKDVKIIEQVLLDPNKGGYEKDKVKVLLGNEATRINILIHLAELAEELQGNPEASAIIYFSGHGYKKSAGEYYLIPYDFNRLDPRGTGIEDQFFSEKIGELSAHRLLLLLDCCHAGETNAAISIPSGFIRNPVDVGAFIDSSIGKPVTDDDEQENNSPGSKPVTDDDEQENNSPGSKPVTDDDEQENNSPGSKPIGPPTRAVLVSSRGSELSWIHKEADMSIFTYHLIEALNGHGKKSGEDTTVNVLDLMSYVLDSVPGTTQSQYGQSQTPNARYYGENFPIALLMGGAGLPEGGQPPSPDDILAEIKNVTVNVSGNDNVVITDSNIAGDVSIDDSEETNTTNIGGHNLSGASFGGDFIAGDNIGGDQVGGDDVSADNTTNS